AGHRGYQQLRGQVADTYAQAGMALNEDQLDRATAAVALSNRQKGLPQADLLVLLPDRVSGTYGPDSTLVAQYGGNAAVPLRSETTAQQMQRPAEETYQQLQQVEQQLALEHRQREHAQVHGSGMAMA
ncbi:XVIPCD domain-containing protein, partial [Pseudoxanthomonas wuyuanensis]